MGVNRLITFLCLSCRIEHIFVTYGLDNYFSNANAEWYLKQYETPSNPAQYCRVLLKLKKNLHSCNQCELLSQKEGIICYAQINNSTNKIFPDEVMQFTFHWLGPYSIMDALQWRHNGHDGVSNHQPHHCLFNRLFRRRSKKTPRHIKYIQNIRIYADWSKYIFAFCGCIYQIALAVDNIKDCYFTDIW